MSKIIRLEAVVPVDFVTELRRRAEATLQGLYDDYFSTKELWEFQSRNLGHESIMMRLANYRFVTPEILGSLKEFLEPHIERVYGATDLVIHPISYLRFSFPGIYYSEKHRKAFLDSQPHYDRSYGVAAFSFWLALDSIDEESGGLCSFSAPEILEHFQVPWGVKNRYSLTSYIEAAETLDPMLRQGTTAPRVRVGDVLTFDSNFLHGATRPRSRVRVSFDFRLAPSANLKQTSQSVHRIFDEVNISFDFCRVNNLILLGDFLGASRILQEYAEKTNHADSARLAQALCLKRPDPEIFQEGVKVPISKEYQWLTQAEAPPALTY